MSTAIGIGDYLIQRLHEHGVRHVFGVPGDFVLSFYQLLTESELQVVNTCDEQGAGFAADAYARMRGLGVACVTYGVGGLKLVNTTGQAYAECSPVVVISGAPSMTERVQHPLLHHRIRGFDTQKLVFEQVTAASTVLDDPETACREIDRVLAVALSLKRPVYIELPRDMVHVQGAVPQPRPAAIAESDPRRLYAALEDAAAMIARAKRPVLVLGEELHRFGLRDAALRLVERTNLPAAVTLLGKSVISELHPNFIGVYAGRMGRGDVCDYVEGSDCILLLGVLLTDLNLGGFTAKLDPERCLHASREGLQIGLHSYEQVEFVDFVNGLVAVGLPRRERAADAPRPLSFAPSSDASTTAPITAEALFRCLAASLTDETVVIADPGDALFGATDFPVHPAVAFLSPAYYASLGFAVPASIGAQLAEPRLRPLVLVGDGAFQMTGMELSTAARFGLNPIVVVLNNGGYVTERLMIDGTFNDVLAWDYSRLPELLGAGRGWVVTTEEELARALREATAHTESFCLLDVRLAKMDVSPALQRLTASLGMAARSEAVASGGSR